MNSENLGEIIIYENANSEAKIDVKVYDDTVWLTQQQMASLYGTTKQNISLHIKNIYEE